MKSLVATILENRKETVKLMRANNVTKIEFIDKDGNYVNDTLPYVLLKDILSSTIVVEIKYVRIDENDNFFVMPFDMGVNVEYKLDNFETISHNNIYVAIEEYLNKL